MDDKNLNQNPESTEGNEKTGAGETSKAPETNGKKTKTRWGIRNPFYREKVQPKKTETEADEADGETEQTIKLGFKERMKVFLRGAAAGSGLVLAGLIGYAKVKERQESRYPDYVDASDEDDDSEESRIAPLPPANDQSEEDEEEKSEEA